MANIFLQLSAFNLNRRALEQITGANANSSVSKTINNFFQSQLSNDQDKAKPKIQYIKYANFLIQLLRLTTLKQGKQKLLIALVYFVVSMETKQAHQCLQKVCNQKQSVILKVKFLSFVFKSTNDQNLKKWIIKSTVTIIENQQKVASFAGLIQHFDQVLQTLTLTQEQTFEIYSKLISYLEKHPVYKKLCAAYVIRSLEKVTQKTANSEQTKKLIIKAIKTGVISDNALSLLNHQALKKNQLYSILEVLLTGDFDKLDLNKIKKLEQDGLVGQDVLRKMKVEAIPRKLSNVKLASYDQVAQILKIKKSEVQSYIIDAIKQGIIKAKLDEFQETVIINRVNFRALRQQERAKLQKDITNLCQNINQTIIKSK